MVALLVFDDVDVLLVFDMSCDCPQIFFSHLLSASLQMLPALTELQPAWFVFRVLKKDIGTFNY